MKVGLIGCGAIGHFLLEKINQEKIFPNVEIVSVLDEREKSQPKLAKLADTYDLSFFSDADRFLSLEMDVVVECANVEAVRHYAPIVLTKKDLLIISVGALVDRAFYTELESIAKEHNRKMILPSGAIGGLDLIQAAKVSGGLQEVTLITRKPAKALLSETVEKETIIFKGKASEAISKFPKNINVAIILSLAGIGVNETNVQIVADPQIDKNIHTIKARGDFGEFELQIANHAMPGNPKTSYLTALSILSLLKSMGEQTIIG
ncbi:aspartate dehydrogenase [Pueribacillus theae]|uniref:L-aspartate dehydrogenase n=1 Tax=Pueribacillus theae TaxID=2171751 RepID=A0A2U1JQF2_9BACI|nr:aspartate dehydrogenase [Pueribacillus theae]